MISKELIDPDVTENRKVTFDKLMLGDYKAMAIIVLNIDGNTTVHADGTGRQVMNLFDYGATYTKKRIQDFLSDNKPDLLDGSAYVTTVNAQS